MARSLTAPVTGIGNTSQSSQLAAPQNALESSLGRTQSHKDAAGDPDAVRDARAKLAAESRDRQKTRLVLDIIEQAHSEDAGTANALLGVVRPFASLSPEIARAIEDLSESLSSRPVATPRSPTPDWTTLIVHDSNGYHAPAAKDVTSQQRSMLRGIAAARAAAPGSAQRVSWIDDKSTGYLGWSYMPMGKTKITAVAAPQSDQLEELAIEELVRDPSSQEGHIDAIDTYDGPRNVAIGAGWTNELAADFVRRWIAIDPSAKGTLLALGFAVTADNQFAVIDDAGNLLVGAEASGFLSKSFTAAKILDSISTQISDPAHSQRAMDAQVEMVKRYRIDSLSDAMKAAMRTWSPDAARVAIHLANWWPAAGPELKPKDYIATGGGGLAILHAFAKNHSGVQRANKALVLGLGSTTGPMDNFVRWGHGYIARAIAGKPIISASFADIGSPSVHPELAGCVLVAAQGTYPKSRAPRFINTGPLVV